MTSSLIETAELCGTLMSELSLVGNIETYEICGNLNVGLFYVFPVVVGETMIFERTRVIGDELVYE